MAAGAPVVDEVGDEVDTRLVGDDEALLEAASHAEAVGAKLLEVGSCLLVKSHIDLVEGLHVVDVHTHHVAQSVGQEHGVGTLAHGLLGVALGQSELLHAVEDDLADAEVDVHIFDAGLGQLQRVVVGLLDDRVDLQLALGKLAVDGEGARVVRAVVLQRLASAVAEHQSAVLQLGHRGVAVHDLAVLRVDGGKGGRGAVGVGRAVDLAADKLLRQSGARDGHGRGVHLVSDDRCALQLLYLLLRLGGTHLHHGVDEVEAGCLLLLVGMDSQQVHDLDLDVVAVGRQEVDAAMLAQGVGHDGAQGLHRSRVDHAYLRGHVGHGVDGSKPYDVLDVDVVADKGLLIVVDIDHTDQSVALLSEIVQERRILSERRIAVVRAIEGAVVVAE